MVPSKYWLGKILIEDVRKPDLRNYVEGKNMLLLPQHGFMKCLMQMKLFTKSEIDLIKKSSEVNSKL